MCLYYLLCFINYYAWIKDCCLTTHTHTYIYIYIYIYIFIYAHCYSHIQWIAGLSVYMWDVFSVTLIVVENRINRIDNLNSNSG